MHRTAFCWDEILTSKENWIKCTHHTSNRLQYFYQYLASLSIIQRLLWCKLVTIHCEQTSKFGWENTTSCKIRFSNQIVWFGEFVTKKLKFVNRPSATTLVQVSSVKFWTWMQQDAPLMLRSAHWHTFSSQCGGNDTWLSWKNKRPQNCSRKGQAWKEKSFKITRTNERNESGIQKCRGRGNKIHLYILSHARTWTCVSLPASIVPDFCDWTNVHTSDRAFWGFYTTEQKLRREEQTTNFKQLQLRKMVSRALQVNFSLKALAQCLGRVSDLFEHWHTFVNEGSTNPCTTWQWRHVTYPTDIQSVNFSHSILPDQILCLQGSRLTPAPPPLTHTSQQWEALVSSIRMLHIFSLLSGGEYCMSRQVLMVCSAPP